jgi:hypothetical protein
MEKYDLQELTALIDKKDLFQKLSNELVDTIIFCSQPTTIAKLKQTCKYLCERASIMRINEPIATRYFMLKKKKRPQFFKRITQTNNPDYIQEILIYGRREAYRLNPPSATTITINKELLEESYIQQHYLPILLKNAIDYDTYYSVLTLVGNGANTINSKMTPVEYAKKHKKQNALKALESSSIITNKACRYLAWGAGIAFGIVISGAVLTGMIFGGIRNHTTH